MYISQNTFSVPCAVCISYGWLDERSRAFLWIFLRKKVVMFEEILRS